MIERYKISVIIPIYKVEKYLRRCLDSVLSQSYRNLEIILVDDGSPDNCGKICDEFSKLDERIIVLHKDNGGLCSARNAGINVATGDWFFFLDSDDSIQTNHIEKYVRNITNDIDIIIGNYTLVVEQIDKRYVPKMDINEGMYDIIGIKNVIIPALLKDGKVMSVWRNLYRKDLVCNNSLFIDGAYAEDFLYNLEAYLRARSIVVLNIATYNHYLLKGTLSQSYRKDMFKMALFRQQKTQEILQENCPSQYDNILLEKRPSTIAYCAYKESLCDFKIAIKNVKKIVTTEFVLDTFKSNNKCNGKYKVIYYCLKNGFIRLSIVISKIFSNLEVIYRYLNYYKNKSLFSVEY